MTVIKNKLNVSFVSKKYAAPGYEGYYCESHEIVISEIAQKNLKKEEYKFIDSIKFEVNGKKITENAESEKCYLQIWELDRYITIAKAHRPKAETCFPFTDHFNRLVAVYSGKVVYKKVNKALRYIFEADDETAASSDEGDSPVAFIRLSPDSDIRKIPLPKYEHVFELGAVIRLQKDDDTFNGKKDIVVKDKKEHIVKSADMCEAYFSPHQGRDVKFALLRQIKKRGGITVAMVTKFTFFDTVKFEKVSVKDQTFHKEAEIFHAVRPAFKIDDDLLNFGFHETDRGYLEYAGIISTLLSKISAVTGIKNLKVANLIMYAHGHPNGMSLTHFKGAKLDRMYEGSLYFDWGNLTEKVNWNNQCAPIKQNSKGKYYCDIKNPEPVGGNALTPISRHEDFVNRIKPYIAKKIVITLMSCSMGRSHLSEEQSDFRVTYGRFYPCEEPGADSIAWYLGAELKKQGIDNYTVWAHATPGHTVRNCNVRVFSALGNAELSNFIILKSSDKKQNFEDIKEWGYARIGAKKSTIFERHLSIQPTEKPPLEKVLHSNLIKMLVVATAESFNWKWQHGLCAEKSADSEKVEEIRKVIAELHSYIVKKENAKNKGKDTFIEVDDEEVVFKSNTTRSHLLVSEKNKPKVKNPQLSKHFMWKDIVGKYPVAKQEYEVPVNTIKALQMLHHRQYPKTELTKKKANKVTKKFEILNISGGEIRFLAEQKDIQAVLDKAKELKKQGFIEWAVREDPAMNIIKMKVVV